jgi:hypothetical protein
MWKFRVPKRVKRAILIALGICFVLAIGWFFRRSATSYARLPGVPTTWDEEALAKALLPLANAAYSAKPISSRTYYWTPIRSIYKTYPVYHPDHEPEDYIDQLRSKEPVEIWDPAMLTSEAGWIQAGELVFDTPLGGAALAPSSFEYWDLLYVRDRRWHEYVKAPIAADGTIPFYRYVVEKKGRVRVGILSCAMCHTRVLEDGTVVKGAQGNLPFDRAFAYDYQYGGGDPDQHAGLERLLYGAPWSADETGMKRLSTDFIVARHAAIPPGVMARHGSTPEHPVVIPDLFDLKERRYLDRTGLQQNHGVADIMRYAALNQGADDLSSFGDFIPVKAAIGFVPPAILNLQGRYSDDQLFALGMYLSSLKPPANPNSLDSLAARGREIFESNDCGRCHTPPDYTSHRLTPVDGFTIPEDHFERYEIEQESLGTDPGLALKTRRGTGYYKIPSLKHSWLRGPFGHDGSCATLEDWFDPRRLDADYVPTGFVGRGIERRPVPGHEYGLDLDEDDRRALIAFLRTL